MVEKTKLVQAKLDVISRGSVLSVPGEFPYEEFVDFMLFETQDDDAPYGLMVISGYKAGLVLVRLPKESVSAAGGVDKVWFLANWNKWVYPNCDVDDVYFLETRSAS